jgi:hypothetical protein
VADPDGVVPRVDVGIGHRFTGRRRSGLDKLDQPVVPIGLAGLDQPVLRMVWRPT